MDSKELAKQLRNIGPVTAGQLIKAGITTPEKLKKLGAKKAFLRVCQTVGFSCHFNACYLYALEGAIRGCDWRGIPESKKKEYKDLTESLRNKAR